MPPQRFHQVVDESRNLIPSVRQIFWIECMTERSSITEQTLYMQKFIEKILTHFLTLPHFPQAEPMCANTWTSEGYRGFAEFLWTFKPDYQPCWIIAIYSNNHDYFSYINQHQTSPEFNKKKTHMLPNPENPITNKYHREPMGLIFNSIRLSGGMKSDCKPNF